MSKDIAAVASKLVSDLEVLKSDEERERAIAGARAILGMAAKSPGGAEHDGGPPPPEDGQGLEGFSTAGNAWIKRNGLTKDTLDLFFHLEDGKVTFIGETIGEGKRQQSINAYLLTGVASLLETGKPDFADQSGREHCKRLGCYDSANHAGTVDQFGNLFTGSKKAGWKVTAPGLKAAAVLLKPTAEKSK